MEGPISEDYVCGDCGSDVRATGAGGSKHEGYGVSYECTSNRCDNHGHFEEEPRIALTINGSTHTFGRKETRTGLEDK